MRRSSRSRGIGDLARGMIERADPKGKRYGALATESWRKVAGGDILKHTHGASLREGELLVFVDSPAWANELTYMSEDLRLRINQDLGQDLVKSMRFAVSKTVKREKDQERAETEDRGSYDKDKVEPVPLTDIERRQVSYTTATIDDEAAREAAEKAMTKYLEWKKGLEARMRTQGAPEDLTGMESTEER